MNNTPSLPMATRRLFLKRTLIALAATLAPPSLYAAAKLSGPAVDEAPSLNALSSEGYQILSAASETLIPSGGAFPVGARDIDLAARIDRYLSPEDPDLLAGLQGALLFVEHKAPELIGKQERFTELDAAAREQTLLAMQHAGGVPLTIFAAVRNLSTFYFYTDQRVWPHIGYDGTLVQQAAATQQIGG